MCSFAEKHKNDDLSISWIKSPKINVEPWNRFYLQAIVLPLSSSLHEIHSSVTTCPMLVTCLQGWNEISTRKIAVWCAPVKRTWSFNCLLSDVRCPPKEKSFPGECIAREEHSSMNFVNKGLQLRTRREPPYPISVSRIEFFSCHRETDFVLLFSFFQTKFLYSLEGCRTIFLN